MDNPGFLVSFLDDYGILISAFLLTLGWFVIFNGTKYITSRNEAKSYVQDYTDLITSSVDNSFEFWGDYLSKKPSEKNLYIKKNKIVLSKLASYIVLLEKYGLEFNVKKDMFKLKQAYTLTPDTETIDDKDKIDVFLSSKILTCEKTALILIQSINNSFTRKYPPTVTPILHVLTISEESLSTLKGTIYGVFLLCVYFASGKYFFGS